MLVGALNICTKYRKQKRPYSYYHADNQLSHVTIYIFEAYLGWGGGGGGNRTHCEIKNVVI
jgi:hypothetical protein